MTSTIRTRHSRVFFGVPWGDGRWACQCDGSRPGQEAVKVQPSHLHYCPECKAHRPPNPGTVPELRTREGGRR